jgi:hypothetical protein
MSDFTIDITLTKASALVSTGTLNTIPPPSRFIPCTTERICNACCGIITSSSECRYCERCQLIPNPPFRGVWYDNVSTLELAELPSGNWDIPDSWTLPQQSHPIVVEIAEHIDKCNKVHTE